MKLFNIFRKNKKNSKKQKACVPDVCISDFWSNSIDVGSERKNKTLLRYPIIYRVVDLISKSIATEQYKYNDYSVVLDSSKLYKVFFDSFVKDVFILLEVSHVNEATKEVFVAIKESSSGVKVQNKQLSVIINQFVELQLSMYYELLFAYYKASKVQGVLLPSNTENTNSISFSLDEQTELSERLERVFTDVKNAYNIISLTVPFEYIPIQKKFNDTGLIELKELIKEDVAYIFGVPSLLLENNSNSTYNNLSEAQRVLYDNLDYYKSVVYDLLTDFIKKTNIIKKKITK